MNPIFNMLNGGNNNIMMQAFAAMARGESPQTFLQGLSGKVPQLRELNLTDLKGTAQALCQKNNIDMNQLANKISEFANSNK